MKRIFKYPCKSLVSNEQHINMPVGAVVRHADYLAGLCIWAEIDTEVKETEERTFVIIFWKKVLASLIGQIGGSILALSLGVIIFKIFMRMNGGG